jgi:hypothetical protein
MHRIRINILGLGLLIPFLLLWTACAVQDRDDPALPADELAIAASDPAPEDLSPLADPVRYQCGYALPGFGCDNGRGHVDVFAGNMQTAIDLCRASQPSNLPDFCYVLVPQGGTSTDASLCQLFGGSWRPGTSCCNFFGTISCPAQDPQYRCGYALPNFGCNNGRSSLLITAPNMQAAIDQCRAIQPTNLPDFCYVRPTAAGTVIDPEKCAQKGGTWRPSSACCNFKGSVSCPS